MEIRTIRQVKLIQKIRKKNSKMEGNSENSFRLFSKANGQKFLDFLGLVN